MAPFVKSRSVLLSPSGWVYCH
uniref:Uncharacterized protein n=1 Tax=Anguilla anguilla TaxID=7936 RepID=A0A0E9SYL8_ANGAN